MAGEIVFVHLGPAPIEYAVKFIIHAREFSGSSRVIFVIGARHPLFDYRWADHGIERIAAEDIEISDLHRSFLEKSTYDRSFRQGFWQSTVERFFVLESTFRTLNLRSAFCAEYDNLLFFDAREMAARLVPCYPGMAATFDSVRRGVPGVMYVNDPRSLSNLTAFIEHRALDYDDKPNDMFLLGEFRRLRKPEIVDALPIMTPDYPHEIRITGGTQPHDRPLFIRNFETVQSVFDAAAIGQYLYGVDPRNIPDRDTQGFINEEAIFEASAYRYETGRDPEGRLRPYLCSLSGRWPLNNMHMHSKRFPKLQPGAIGISGRRGGFASIGRFLSGARRALRAAGSDSEKTAGRQSGQQRNPIDAQLAHASELEAFKCSSGAKSIGCGISSPLPVDVVIPVADRDKALLPYAVESLRRNLKHPLGRIFIIASPGTDLQSSVPAECILVDERSLLPLQPQDIPYRVDGLDRAGWLFQQFLKLASDSIVEASHYVVLDADTVLVRPQVFELDGLPLLLHSDEHHEPYFEICERLLGLPRPTSLSCVAHSMLVDRARLSALKRHIERRFDRPWFEAVLSQADLSNPSCFSEFELYGQWCLHHHQFDTAREYWLGANLSGEQLSSLPELERQYGGVHRLLAFHWYMRAAPAAVDNPTRELA